MRPLEMTISMVQPTHQESENNVALAGFSELTKAYYEQVYHFIAKQSPNQADAADITQQTFVRAFKSFHKFDSQREFAPWIYTIARRSVADFYRQRKQTTVDLDESLADPEPGPREQTVAADNKENLWELARGLKVKYYQVLLLHYKENFDLRETASIMGVSLTHAKVLLFRARAALKKRIESTQAIGGLTQ
ncbi:MAG: RNA polymerase sigma factor [Puniceicoccaceae bacterium]